jgi:large subunit ribosomal protein L13
MKTCRITPDNLTKKWLTVDAAGIPVGRVASEIARLLRGKHKAEFVPHLDCGDNVLVLNASKIVLTGRKWDQKIYHRHTGYIGGIKAVIAKDLMVKHPERILESAVRGMLPKTKLGRKVFKNLRVCAANEHNLSAQQPEAAPKRLAE